MNELREALTMALYGKYWSATIDRMLAALNKTKDESVQGLVIKGEE